MTQTVLNTHFKDALDKNILIFKPINVQKEDNKHFIQRYKLTNRYVVLSLEKEGKEINYIPLPDVWRLSKNPEDFESYMLSNIKKIMPSSDLYPKKTQKKQPQE